MSLGAYTTMLAFWMLGLSSLFYVDAGELAAIYLYWFGCVLVANYLSRRMHYHSRIIEIHPTDAQRDAADRDRVIAKLERSRP